MSFPADLPDLLRIACSQGSMQLNVWFNGGERGYQANLSNVRGGSTVDYNADSLEAMTAVLRIRYGKMLERQRAAGRPLTAAEAAAAVHPAHLGQMVSTADEFGALL